MAKQSLPVYLRIARIIEQQILQQVIKTGDKLPSLRTLSLQHGISQTTAISVYHYLESKALIAARPQSGYYVTHASHLVPAIMTITDPTIGAQTGNIEQLVESVYNNLGEGGCFQLALGAPATNLLPVAKLNKGVVAATRELQASGIQYDKVQGNERLRRQIARWSLGMHAIITHHDIITTSGCLNALSYALMALTGKGDSIALESPVSFGMLQLCQALGLKVIEMPTHPVSGVDLNALEDVIKKKKIKVCLLISNFSNPLGSCMPDENKKQAVRLIEKHNIPLLENDVNGDVYFGDHRPRSCKSYDESGLVLWCGSVSKTLAPGYRVGWIAPGRFKENVLRIKSYHSISGTGITQEAIASFLENGRYEGHLRKLRSSLHANLIKYTGAIAEHFPDGTSVTRPQGGFVQWVQLPRNMNTVEIFERAIKRKISFAPGRIFTLQKRYDNCMRLNLGLEWNDNLAYGLRTLGKMARDY